MHVSQALCLSLSIWRFGLSFRQTGSWDFHHYKPHNGLDLRSVASSAYKIQSRFALSPPKLLQYAEAIEQAGAALNNCWGFVDGTVRPVYRPNENQRAIYNGHKRVYSIKFQAVALPNGLVGNLFGPVEGRRHDSFMLASSWFLQELQRFSNCPVTGLPLCVYGDPAYPIRAHLQRPFKGGVLTPAQQDFNTSMSTVRSSVEWLFGDIVNYFKFLDF